MSQAKQGKRRGLRIWHVILGIVGLLILGIGLWFFMQYNRVRTQLQALQAQGQPTSHAEWTQQHQVPPGVQNAADSYTMAFRAFYKPDHNNGLPYSGRGKLPPLGEPLPEAMVQEIEQFVAKNESVLTILRQARDVQQCYYDWDPRQETSDLSLVRSFVQLLSDAAILQAQRGDTEAVLAYVGDMLAVAGSVRNEQGLVYYLVHQGCAGLAIRVRERALNMTTFTDEQLVQADDLLAKAVSTMDMTQAWMGERCNLIECIRNPSPQGDPESFIMKVPGLTVVGMADVLDYMGDCIEASKLPPAERSVRVKEIFDGLFELSHIHVIGKMLAPALGRVAELDVRSRVNMSVARTALAIERYRLAKGQLPEDLQSLVPDYMDQVPIDPYDGQPLRYRPTDPGYILYSIGEDKEDNNGQSKEQVERDKPYDWPFIIVK